MVHPAPEQFYPLILEDYFFSLVDHGVPPEKTPLFTGNLNAPEGEDLPSAVGRRFGLSEHEAILHLVHAREEVAL
jgi:hypothetical protein